MRLPGALFAVGTLNVRTIAVSAVRSKLCRKSKRLIEFVVDNVSVVLGGCCGVTDVLRDLGGEVSKISPTWKNS